MSISRIHNFGTVPSTHVREGTRAFSLNRTSLTMTKTILECIGLYDMGLGEQTATEGGGFTQLSRF